jgi:transposase
MPKILSQERVIEYSVEFKVKVVRLTNELDVKAIEIAKLLNLHPMMIYRWRQENREGKFVEVPSRRISITKNSAPPKPNTDKTDEIKSLRKELEKVKKENDFLKKWDQYLKDKKKSDSDS